MDETTEGADDCAISWDWEGAESFDEVVVNPVAVCGDFEAAVACRWRPKDELAGMEGDAMLGASADHFAHTVHMGVQVSVVDNDIFNYFLDVV